VLLNYRIQNTEYIVIERTHTRIIVVEYIHIVIYQVISVTPRFGFGLQ